MDISVVNIPICVKVIISLVNILKRSNLLHSLSDLSEMLCWAGKSPCGSSDVFTLSLLQHGSFVYSF